MGSQKIVVILLFLTISITSCGYRSQSISQNNASITMVISSTSIPKHNKTATDTYLPAATSLSILSPTITLTPAPVQPTVIQISPTIPPNPSPTPTNSSWMTLETECLEIAPELPEDFGGIGSIALWKMQGADHSISLNMETGVKSIIKDDWNWWEWSISPDERWLTLQKDEDTSTVQVLNTEGKLLNTIKLEEGWGLSGWLDNTRLEIYKSIDPENKIYSLIAINSFTGNLQYFPEEYPDIYTLGVNFFPIEYDPTLKLLIYPFKSKGEMGFRLMDIGNGQILASIPSFVSLSSGPRWSSDGKNVIVTGSTNYPNIQNGSLEFFLATRDGVVRQLTDLGAYNASINMDSYSWSPDGQYIAFWMTINEDPFERLAVLDINSHDIINYCIQGQKPFGADPPIWSPDSQQMVLFDPSLDGPVVVVDIKQKKAATIGMYLQPVFWLKTVPDVWISNNP